MRWERLRNLVPRSLSVLQHVLAHEFVNYPELLICFEFTIILNLEDCVPGFVVAEKTGK